MPRPALRRQGHPRLERAAVRFVGRVLVERPGLGFSTASRLLDGLSDLDGLAPYIARNEAETALTVARLTAAARYIASYADLSGLGSRR